MVAIMLYMHACLRSKVLLYCLERVNLIRSCRECSSTPVAMPCWHSRGSGCMDTSQQLDARRHVSRNSTLVLGCNVCMIITFLKTEPPMDDIQSPGDNLVGFSALGGHPVH